MAISECFASSFSSFLSLFPSNGGDNGEKPPPFPMIRNIYDSTSGKQTRNVPNKFGDTLPTLLRVQVTF
jgi:hypothetical protein